MTDQETQTESPAEEPVSPASETPTQEPSSDYVSRADLEATLGTLEERLAKRLKQSTGDRIRSSVTSEVKEALAEFDDAAQVLAPLFRDDVKPEQIEQLKERKFIRDLMAQTSPNPEPEPASPSQPPAPEPASSPTGLEGEISAILQSHNLSGSEPELAEYLRTNKGKPWYQVGSGFAELAGQVAQRAGGTPAGVAPQLGQTARRDLAAEFRQEVGELLKQPHRNPRLLRTLEAKYRSLGLTDEQMQVGSTDSVKTRDYLYAAEGLQ